MDAEPVQAVEHARRCAVEHPAQLVAAALVDVEADEHARERGDRRGPGVQVGRGGDLEQVLDLGGAGDEREQRRVGLGEPRHEHDVVVGLVAMADHAVAGRAVVARLVRAALTDHAEAVGVVDVEQRAVLAGDRSERADVRRVAGHAVDAVHAHEPRGVALGAQQLVEVVRILEAEPLDRRAAGAGDLTAVVDRLVCARVQEDRARRGEQRDHGHVDVRDRRQDERVLAAEHRGEPLLDLLVDDGAAEQSRPARVGAPGIEVGGDRLDDLAIEVEAEVVARREVGEPVVADPDHAAVDLVDDGVHHRMRRLQPLEVPAGVQPVLDPRTAAAVGAWSGTRGMRAWESGARRLMPASSGREAAPLRTGRSYVRRGQLG